MTDKKSSENIDLYPPTEPTEIVKGLIYYQRPDEIVVYKFTKMTRKLIDTYALCSEYNDARILAENGHSRVLYDGRGMFPTPYFISTVIRLAKETPRELKESIAIVTGDNLTTSVMRTVIKKLDPKLQNAILFFKNEEDALRWLNKRHAEMTDDMI